MKTFDDFLTEASNKPSVQKGFIIAYEKQFETVYYRFKDCKSYCAVD